MTEIIFDIPTSNSPAYSKVWVHFNLRQPAEGPPILGIVASLGHSYPMRNFPIKDSGNPAFWKAIGLCGTCSRILDKYGIEVETAKRWDE